MNKIQNKILILTLVFVESGKPGNWGKGCQK